MSQCKIYLENYNGTYYPGNEIRGRLECYFSDDTSVRGVKIKVQCQEHNEWTGSEEYTDPRDNKVKTRYVTYTGDNYILNDQQWLSGSGSGSHVLSRGRHVLPFSYVLHDDIPSTYSGPHGSISYKIKATVDIPMGFDHEDSFIFVVVAPIDFNKLPKSLQEPSNYSDEKTVCCWCCQGGNITMDVELPKSAFVSGESINMKINVINLSNTNVDDLSIKFEKTVVYKVESPSNEKKTDHETIASIKEHGVGAHGEHTYNIQIPIPQHIVVPNFARCRLFEVKYKLEILCELGGCSMDMEITIENIKLGNIQWRDAYNQGATITQGFINSLPPIDGAYPPQIPPVYPPGPSPYPPQNNMGFVSITDNPSAPLLANKSGYPGYSPPLAPTFGPTAPPKAQEAAMPMGGPSAPRPDFPPPSYNEVQQPSTNVYSPR